MNLFVVGSGRAGTLSPDPAQGALEEVARLIPRLAGSPGRGWTAPDGSAVAACLSSAPADVGGVEYSAFLPDAMATFAGAPIAWRDATEADGQEARDPRAYLRPAAQWRAALDGRYAVARWTDDAGLEVFTDALARFPVYLMEGAGGAWASNNALALRVLAGDDAPAVPVLAHFFAGGWSLGGDPVWAAVRSVERGTRVSMRDGAVTEERDVLRDEELPPLFDGPGSAPPADELLVAGAHALGTWPGRRVQIGLSGGYDSRLVLAAARRAGVDFEVVTKALPSMLGYPETPDVVAARAVCDAAGLPQAIVDAGVGAGIYANVGRAVALLRATGPGTVALGDSHELPLDDAGPPPVVFTGTGTEVAKLTYQTGEDETLDEFVARVFAKMSPARPARLVNREGEHEVTGWLRAWAQRHSEAGVRTRDLPTLFHLLVRVGRWSAAGLASRDHGQEAAQPGGVRPLLPHQLGLGLEERRGKVFHADTTRRLDPVIASAPYEQVTGSLRTRIAREARRRAGVELRRLLRRGPRDGVGREFAGAFGITAEAVMSRPDHAAWHVLDRDRVEKLLRRDPDRLDPRSRQQVLRLATIFVEP